MRGKISIIFLKWKSRLLGLIIQELIKIESGKSI